MAHLDASKLLTLDFEHLTAAEAAAELRSASAGLLRTKSPIWTTGTKVTFRAPCAMT